MGKINVVHAFSGVDSQLMAEKRVWGDDVNVLATMEVDVDAIISCAAIHENQNFVKMSEREFTPEQMEFAKKWLKERNVGFDFDKGKSKVDRMKKEKLKQLYMASRLTNNLGDISLANKIKLEEDVDIFTYSSPCQSFSVAGKQEGLKGTSGLLLECERFIEINKPKVLLLENVKNLVGKQFKSDFDNWCGILDKLGYNTYWKILNAKHLGVPQNRERVFALSIRKDLDCGYEFPEGFPLETRLKDVLDEKVDDKYYLSDEIVSRFTKFPNNRLNNKDIEVVGTTTPNPYNEKGELIYDKCTSAWVLNPDKLCNTLAARDYKQPKQILEKTNNIILAGEVPITNYNHINKVYDKNGICCTLDTMQGGHRQPKILEEPKIIQIGNYMEDHPNFKNRNAGRVYDAKGVSPTLISHQTGGSNSVKILEEPIVCEQRSDEGLRFFKDNICGTLRTIDSCGDKRIVEPIIAASRGRNPNNPSDRTVGAPTEQRLEFNHQGISNTLTTVQKDNYVVEPQVLRYERTEFGKAVRKEYEAGNTDLKMGDIRELKPRQDGISNTLTTVQKDNYVIEPLLIKEATKKGYSEAYEGDSVNLEQPNSQTRRGRVGNQIANTLMTSCNQGVVDSFRIRKLTPRECWRLMDFDADAFDKVRPFVSDSALYKQAGNSIVVSCMEHIFKNLDIYKIKGE